MAREEFYPLSKARNEFSAVIRKVAAGLEVAVITVDGRPVAKIMPHAAKEVVTKGSAGGMTVEQIRKALDATEGHPEMLRSMLELFV